MIKIKHIYVSKLEPIGWEGMFEPDMESKTEPGESWGWGRWKEKKVIKGDGDGRSWEVGSGVDDRDHKAIWKKDEDGKGKGRGRVEKKQGHVVEKGTENERTNEQTNERR
jgi:hypothetical protein